MAEVCSFRDRYEDLREVGAEVVGISSDSDETHAGFAARHQLPFLLVSGAAGSIREAYGVPRTFSQIPGRVTYMIHRSEVVLDGLRPC